MKGRFRDASKAMMVEALRDGLRDLGYTEGKSIVIEYRWADGKYDRLPEPVAELIHLKVDVILTHACPPSRGKSSNNDDSDCHGVDWRSGFWWACYESCAAGQKYYRAILL
ncbi:MAG: hypothetical protein ABIS45_15560 [Burkholderiales bacterium]